MQKIEDALQLFYNKLSHSPKRLGIEEVDNIVETCSDCILRNVKTRWISMLMLAKHVLSKYKALIMKMNADQNSIAP